MSLRRYITWILGLIILMLIGVAGEMLLIGEKIMIISHVLGWTYFAILFILLIRLILIPIFRVITMPEIINGIILDDKKKVELKQCVKQSAKTSLLLTTVSQNSSIDVLSNATISFRLIWTLVKQTGCRPTLPQLLRLYVSVITSSLIVASVDEVIDNLELTALIGNAGIGSICKLFQPLMNGTANAYACMRVGYATIKYLEHGSKSYNRDKSAIRKAVAKEARRDLIPLMKDEVKDIVASVR